MLIKTWHYVLLTALKIDVLDDGVPTSLTSFTSKTSLVNQIYHKTLLLVNNTSIPPV